MFLGDSEPQEWGLQRYLDHKNVDIFGDDRGPGEQLQGVATGVFLQSLAFPSANDAAMTGVVWQRLTKEQLLTITPGVIFPEAVESDVEPLYRRPIREHGEEVGTVFGYSFKLTVREQFDFHRYPFDTKDVWLRMWPTDFDSNVVLIPDLSAYPEIDPARLPGLEDGLVLAGWEPLRAYFQYREGDYSMDFGNRDYVGTEGFPELNYTVDVQRNFINTLVSDLIPLAVVTFLLYGVLRTISTKHDRLALTGFSFTSVLGACSGLVFVILLGHIQLRNALAGQEITYLEWYYFIIYIALVLICINAWTLIVEEPPKWLAWGDNAVARLAFWPLITTAIFLATAVYFYPQLPKAQADDAPARMRSHEALDRKAG